MQGDIRHRPARRMRHVGAPALALALTLATTGPAAQAQEHGEPFNNNWPMNSPNKVIFQHSSGGSGAASWHINPSGDVDYHVLACSQTTVGDDPRFLNKVRIDLSSGAGDLDIDVYTWNFFGGERWLGGSYGTGNQEEVTIPGRFNSVYLKVRGYNGATGGYATYFDCR